MGKDEMVEINLPTDFRDDDEERTLYTAGPKVAVPRSVADKLAAVQEAQDAPTFDAAGANRDDLAAEADRRGLDVQGSGKEGYVTADDYRAALA